jgi:hypothetical protein
MRALVGLVVVMAVLIVAGVVTIGVTVMHRLGGVQPGAATASSLVLTEPAGTHIAGASESAGRLTTVLQGGGPDRIVVLDIATGRVLARIALAPVATNPPLP